MSGLDVGISAILTAYSVMIMVIAIWGYAILPKKCTKGNIRNSARWNIICGAVMATAVLSYGLCSVTCKKEKSGDNQRVPTWLLAFVLAISSASISFGANLTRAIKDNIDICDSEYYEIWKQSIGILTIFHILVICILSIMLGYRAYVAVNS